MESGEDDFIVEYRYKFVRLGVKGLFAPSVPDDVYKDAVKNHAKDGWRLVQIFAPPLSGHGRAEYYELILERECPPETDV